jgi:hypothetical protein
MEAGTMSDDDGGLRKLSEQHLLAAYELGGDHAEDGLRRRMDAPSLWELIVDHPGQAFEDDAPTALLRSYEAGHLDLW